MCDRKRGGERVVVFGEERCKDGRMENRRGRREKERKGAGRLAIIPGGVRWASQVPMGALACPGVASWALLCAGFLQAARSS